MTPQSPPDLLATALPAGADDTPLGPLRATIAAAFGAQAPKNLAAQLVVADAPGWISACAVADGTRLPDLLAVAGRRRRAPPHAAAALFWKAYTYALSLPAVVGWACARRVPLVRPADVLIGLSDPLPLLTIGLRSSIRVAVLASDPIALSGREDIEVALDEAALLQALRGSLLDAHLDPMQAHIRRTVRLGARPLRGSLASGVAHAVLDAADALPGSTAEHIETLLTTLGVRDLVEIRAAPGGGLCVRRQTCCLAFTLPEHKICPSCCLPGAADGSQRGAVADSGDSIAGAGAPSVGQRVVKSPHVVAAEG
jgi:hypothetical protein